MDVSQGGAAKLGIDTGPRPQARKSVSGRLGAIPAARRIKSRSVPGIQSVAVPSRAVETVGHSSMHACTRIESSFSTYCAAQKNDSYCHDSSDQDNSAPTERTRDAVAHSLCRFSHVCIRTPFSTLSTAFRGPYRATDQKVPVPHPLPSPSGSGVRIRCGPAQGEGAKDRRTWTEVSPIRAPRLRCLGQAPSPDQSPDSREPAGYRLPNTESRLGAQASGRTTAAPDAGVSPGQQGGRTTHAF